MQPVVNPVMAAKLGGQKYPQQDYARTAKCITNAV